MNNFQITAGTHPGYVRTSNEDRFGANLISAIWSGNQVVSVTETSNRCLAVVADGLGGHSRGELASRIAVEHVIDASPTDGESLLAAVHSANAAIFETMRNVSDAAGMGTTLAAVLLVGESVIVVNVGDSAVFEFVEGRIFQLSVDDSPPTAGRLPGVVLSVVTQSLGGATRFTPVNPHIRFAELHSGTRLLLCTDGLTNFVPKERIADVLRYEGDDAVRLLLALALEAGGPDNITVMTVDATVL